MAAEVIHGETLSWRSGQWICLFLGILAVALAAAPYPLHLLDPDPEGQRLVYGYSADLWFVRAFFAALALLAVRPALRLRSPISTPVVEVSSDAIRWVDSYGPERLVPRAAVRSVHAGPMYIRFEPALGERIRELPISGFDWRAIKESLKRHHWNVE